jgi:hypothetical protein
VFQPTDALRFLDLLRQKQLGKPGGKNPSSKNTHSERPTAKQQQDAKGLVGANFVDALLFTQDKTATFHST